MQITGRFSLQEAHTLVMRAQVRRIAGADRIRRRTHGWSVARSRFDSRRAKFPSSSARFSFWSLCRSIYDRAGFLADFGLTLNILLLLCMMAALGATLTLPGHRGNSFDARKCPSMRTCWSMSACARNRGTEKLRARQ